MNGKVYDAIGVGVATVESLEGEGEMDVIGLSFPLFNPPRPDEPNHDDNFEDVFMPVSAAKALLIDLRDAIESVVQRKPFA